jgi:putative ABC transport system permease protein
LSPRTQSAWLLLLSVSSGQLGLLFVHVIISGYAVSTLGGGFTQVAFEFAVTPPLVRYGLGLAIAIAVIGGLAPTNRAARIPVTSALLE